VSDSDPARPKRRSFHDSVGLVLGLVCLVWLIRTGHEALAAGLFLWLVLQSVSRP